MRTTATKETKKICNFFRSGKNAIKLFAILAVSTTSIANAQEIINNGNDEASPVKEQFSPVEKIIGGQNIPVRNVIGAPICPSINSLNMVDLGYNKVLVKWTNPINFDSIFFRFAPSGSNLYRIVAIPGSPNPGRYFIQGLLSQTTYDIEVSTKCGATNSTWSSPLTVTTFVEPGPRFAGATNPSNVFQLSVTPNPANDLIKINFISTNTHLNYNIRIADQSGRLLFNVNIASNLGSNDIPLNISSYAPGIYFVSVTSAKSTSVQKLIVY